MKNKTSNLPEPEDGLPKPHRGNKVKDFLSNGLDGSIGKGLETGVSSILTKTILRRLPGPLGFVAPIIVEKVIMKYGAKEGRNILLKGLKWVKKVTDEDPIPEVKPV